LKHFVPCASKPNQLLSISNPATAPHDPICERDDVRLLARGALPSSRVRCADQKLNQSAGDCPLRRPSALKPDESPALAIDFIAHLTDNIYARGLIGSQAVRH